MLIERWRMRWRHPSRRDHCGRYYPDLYQRNMQIVVDRIGLDLAMGVPAEAMQD
jgi:hypothetical protein